MAGDLTFLREIEKKSGERVSACYGCCRCTNGCPAVPDMDLLPHQVIRHIILGNRDRVLQSITPWACVQCTTCSVRCPNDIHIAHVLETLRKLAVREHAASDPATWEFDRLFLESVKKHGRLHELATILRYKGKKGGLFGETRMGLGMLLKGRMGLMAHNIKGRGHMEQLFERLGGEGDE